MLAMKCVAIVLLNVGIYVQSKSTADGGILLFPSLDTNLISAGVVSRGIGFPFNPFNLPPQHGYQNQVFLDTPRLKFPIPEVNFDSQLATNYDPLSRPNYGPPPKPSYNLPPKPIYGPPPRPVYGPPPRPVYGPPSPRPIYGPPSYDSGESYLSQPVCIPEVKYEYVTKYKTAQQEIPIYKTLISKHYVPTTLYHTNYQTQLVTKYHTEYEPKYVTTTQYVPHVSYVTDYKTDYETEYVTKYVPTQVYVPTYVTDTAYVTKYVTDIQYHTAYNTVYQPKYLTKTVWKTDLQYVHSYLPTYVTITKEEIVYKTTLPNKCCNNHY